MRKEDRIWKWFLAVFDLTCAYKYLQSCSRLVLMCVQSFHRLFLLREIVVHLCVWPTYVYLDPCWSQLMLAHMYPGWIIEAASMCVVLVRKCFISVCVCVCVCVSTHELYRIWLALLQSDLRWVDGARENLITTLVKDRMEDLDVVMECVHTWWIQLQHSQVNWREQERLVDLRHLWLRSCPFNLPHAVRVIQRYHSPVW